MSNTVPKTDETPRSVRVFQRRQLYSIILYSLFFVLLGGLFLYEALSDGWLTHEADEITAQLGLPGNALDDTAMPSMLVLLVILLTLVPIVWNYLQTRRMLALHAALEEALAKLLSGFVPICMYCKSVRDTEDTWHSVEQYLAQRVDLQFSHGICPTCFQQHFAEDTALADEPR